MKNRILAGILAMALFASVFSGCNGGGESSVAETPKPEAIQTPKPTEAPTPEPTEAPTPEPSAKPVSTGEKPDFGPLSEDIYSFQVEINGEVYQFPMTVAQFSAYGWVIDEDLEELDANYRTLTTVFDLGEQECYTSVVNFDINKRSLQECYVGSISFDSYQVEKGGAKIVLPGGLQYGVASVDDVKNKYGTPTDEMETSSGKVILTYSKDYDQEVKLDFDEETKLLVNVKIENLTKPEDFVDSAVNTEVPAIVGKYAAPSALSDNFADFTVDYGGVLYQLPAPVSVFEANGWVLDEAESTMTINGRGYGWILMRKDNQKLKVIAQNYSESATAASNAFVCDVLSNESDCKIPLILSKGITLGMSQTDLEAALADANFEKDEEGASYVYYRVFTGDSKTNCYEIYVSKDTSAISIIEASNTPKYTDYTAE